MHGCGWDSGAARERSSALAASVASRYELGADGVGAARPGACGSPAAARGLLGRVPCLCQKTWGNHEI